MTRSADLVLVTGGNGFVGSHVVDALVAAGAAVRVVDRVATRPDGDELPAGVELLVGDLADPALAAAAVAGVGAVCHQASKVGLGVDFADAPAYARDNDLATAVLLAALHGTGFRGRVVLASSMVVYGEGAAECRAHGPVRAGPRSPDDLAAGRWEPACPRCGDDLRPRPVTEDAPPDPRNVYAATKLHQEHLCAAYGREHGVPVTALRYHNVYGPRMPRDTPYAGVAAIFAGALARGEAPRVFEDGGQTRDFVHVHDVARANVLALCAADAVDGPLNVASGTPRSVGDLAAALVAAAGPAAPAPQVVGGWRAGDVRHVFASPARADERLGFRARIGLEEGVRALAPRPAPG